MHTVTVLIWCAGKIIKQKSFLFKDIKTAKKFMKSEYKDHLNKFDDIVDSICLTKCFEINFSHGCDVTYWLTKTRVME